MKRLPFLSLCRQLVMVLVVLLLVSSCGQPGQSNNPSVADEVLALGNIDPSIVLSSEYIFCPIIPDTAISIPPEPYDEQIGDCSLKGKSAEIDAWLTALEQIAASCQANGEANWAAALASRDYLDSKLDEIGDLMVFISLTIETDDDEDETMEGRLLHEAYVILNLRAEEDCPDYPLGLMDSSSGERDDMSNNYITKLNTIGDNVEKYCAMTDKIIEPLWQACDEINFYQDCQAPDLPKYYAIIEEKMSLAQDNYEEASLFYTNTLQTAGWDDFRSSFSAASLDCPLDSQAPDTKFTFSQNAFCRKGSSSEYEKVATFLEGQDVQILGRNHHEPRWWWVPNPGARGNCWVSDSTGAAEGPVEEIEIIASPPLVINQPRNDQPPKCTKDLEKSSCKAAGGNWVGGTVGASHCDCK